MGLGLETNHVWWSGGLKARLGYDNEGDAQDADWWIECIHLDDRERVSGSIHAAIAGEGSAWSDEYRFKRRDGTYATVLDRGLVVRRDGVAVRMLGSMIDISARASAEQALRELEERHRQILDAIADCVLVKGPHSKIVWANRAFREMYAEQRPLRGLIDAPSASRRKQRIHSRRQHRVRTANVDIRRKVHAQREIRTLHR